MERTREAYFDALRDFAPDGHLSTEDFRMLDTVARRWRLPEAGAAPELHPSPAAVALIQSFEGCERKQADGSLRAYPDPGTGGEPWTIGWGSTGADIHSTTTWSRAQADARFRDDLERFGAKVSALLGGVATSQNEYDALCSFAYNVGLHALEASTLLKLHKAGKKDEAAEQFGHWVNAGGKPMAGLVRRRAAEADLYRGKIA
jgi:lysozyme